MSTQTTPPSDLDPFESRLLAELRREVAVVDTPAPGRTRRRGLALAAGVAATAVVGVVLVPGLGTTPAYSVQEGNAGEIVVEVNRPEDAAGLEQALGEYGIAANITYLAWPLTCIEDRYVDAPPEQTRGMTLSIGSNTLRITLPPGSVLPGDTVVLSLSHREVGPGPDTEDGIRNLGGSESSVDLGVTPGPVGPCEAVPAAD